MSTTHTVAVASHDQENISAGTGVTLPGSQIHT